MACGVFNGDDCSGVRSLGSAVGKEQFPCPGCGFGGGYPGDYGGALFLSGNSGNLAVRYFVKMVCARRLCELSGGFPGLLRVSAVSGNIHRIA